jgi:ATP-binding cassette subfamily B protein
MLAVVAFSARRYYGRRRAWTDLRLSMTHDLVQRMVGHRTRSAQEPERSWHDGEDQALERYIHASLGLDQTSIALTAVGRAERRPTAVLGTGLGTFVACTHVHLEPADRWSSKSALRRRHDETSKRPK